MQLAGVDNYSSWALKGGQGLLFPLLFITLN